ncbi:hypothetical protein [Actinoplanes italicus]|nr:hypothetical protein [Actinoplanes italicus]
MPRFDRPSKPYAVFVAIFGLALLVFGVVQVTRQDGFHWFLVVWVLVGLGMIGYVLAQGFGRRRDAPVEDSEPLGVRLARNRPLAVTSALVGLGAIVYVSIRMSDGKPLGSWLFFALFGLAAIGFNLWSAFSRRGSTGTVTRRD